MKPTKTQIGAGLLAVLILTTAAVGAYTVLFTAGTGTAYETPSDLRVETATDHGLSDANPFVNNETVYIDGVNFAANGTTSLTVTQFGPDFTNTTTVDATNASIIIAPDARPNVTVAGSPIQFDVGNITVGDTDTDIVIDGSGTTTVQPENLPASTTVYAVDASGKIIAKNTTDANGNASFDISHASTVRVDYGNGDLVHTFAGSQRQISFQTDVTTQSPTLSLDANSGPNVTVTGSTDVRLADPFPFANTVNLSTTSGSAEFTANGASAATVAASDIEGDYTNLTAVDASTNALQADPGDKAQLTIDGAATAVAWRDYTPNDGTADLVITGPDSTSSDVTMYGLSADTDYTLWNETTQTPVAVSQTDGSGRVTFTVGHSTETLLLQEGDQSRAPTQDNASPTGDLDQEPSDLSVEVDDADFPDDEVDVTIDLDGSQIHTETVSDASVVSTTIPASGLAGGEHTWTVNTTDRFGNTRIEQYTYRTPAELEIRNETNTSELITDPIDTTVRFYGETQIYERITSDGTLNLTGLPINQPLVVGVEASANYTSRTVYFNTGDIYEQQTVYLLNNNISTVTARFTLNDPTGQYDENSVLYISRPINDSGTTEWRTVHADQFGVEGVTAILEEDQRYRLRITDDIGGLSQDLGPYRTDVSETVEITPASPGVEFDVAEDGIRFGAELDNTTLTWSYSDLEGETDELTVWIHERGNPDNQLVANETYLNVQNASGQTFLTVNESEKEWAVNFIVDRDGTENTYQTVVSKRPGLIPDGLADSYRKIAAIGALLLFAGALSVLNVGVGAIVFGVAAGLLWFTGWLGGVTSGVAIVAYMLVAVLVYITKGGRL